VLFPDTFGNVKRDITYSYITTLLPILVSKDLEDLATLHPEDGDSKFLRNIGILHHYTASQPRRPRLKFIY